MKIHFFFKMFVWVWGESAKLYFDHFVNFKFVRIINIYVSFYNCIFQIER